MKKSDPLNDVKKKYASMETEKLKKELFFLQDLYKLNPSYTNCALRDAIWDELKQRGVILQGEF